MASTDGSDSDICYLPPTELTTSRSRNDGDSRSRTSRSEREATRSCSRRRYRSGSREFKMERQSRSRSISPEPSKIERRSRRTRSRSNSRESSNYSKYSRQSRNESGSSSRERQRKFMKYGRRSNSSNGSSNHERRHRKNSRRSSSSKGSSIHEGRHRKYSRRSSSSKERGGYERNTNYRSSNSKDRSNYERNTNYRSSSSKERGGYERNTNYRSSSSKERGGYERNTNQRSSSSKERSGYERNTNYRIKSRSSSREIKREDRSNDMTNSGKTQRKGEKKTFFCDLCLIELNSEDTMISHANGVKHTKKSSEYDQKRMDEAARGKNLPEKKIRQIANPEATKKKIPIRLHEKIKESRDPVVGLKYIREFITSSDPEMEPYYECELCGSCGHANHIFCHIMGGPHRQNFVEKIFKREIEKGQKRYLNMKTKPLLVECWKYNENNDKISSMIRTEVSDEKYPWPPEKAPWSKAKGGDGEVPVNARKWAKSRERKQDNDKWAESCERKQDDDKTFSRRDVKERSQVRIKDEKRGSLPPPNKLGPPKNLEDAKKFIDLGSQMIKMAIDSNNSMEASQKLKLKNALESMAKEMEKARRKHDKNNPSG